MNSYVITYNDIDHGDHLLYEIETIEGKNPMDALKKRFKQPLKRLTGESGRYANVIITRGYFENNAIHYCRNCAQLCYGLME